jgi:hypothetical protein
MKLLFLLLFPILVLASDPIDKSETFAGKNAILRDGTGKISTTTNTLGNTTTFRDSQGRVLVSASQSSTTFRDAQGRIECTLSGSGSSTNFKDAQGPISGGAGA